MQNVRLFKIIQICLSLYRLISFVVSKNYENNIKEKKNCINVHICACVSDILPQNCVTCLQCQYCQEYLKKRQIKDHLFQSHGIADGKESLTTPKRYMPDSHSHHHQQLPALSHSAAPLIIYPDDSNSSSMFDGGMQAHS